LTDITLTKSEDRLKSFNLSARLPVRWLAILAIALLWIVVFAPPSMAQSLEPLAIVSGDERHQFSVEIADTPAARSRGLMFRRSMPANQGMLFDFERDEMVSMWMRNTYISLDMLFIRKDGTIARIAEQTEPLSERTISSGEPVRSVLELNAGTAARLGISVDDRVEHQLFTAQ
jgi:uncharacterized membrane protein (UPF0127 family)